VDSLVKLASEVLAARKQLKGSIDRNVIHDSLTEILRVGTSAGGARAKAVVAWNPITDELRSGQVAAGEGFEYWILKFDGVTDNGDKDMADPVGFGVIEYAYSLMARSAGIDMTQCRLLEENGRRHFMTRRFDRLDGGQKLHMQSLCALAHYDFNNAGAYSYEQVLRAIKVLKLPTNALEEQYRRMVFNVLARNQDDHVKNVAFLMDKNGNWSLSPAFDITYSYNPMGLWTSTHQLTINGKRDGFTLEDLLECAHVGSISKRRALHVIDQVSIAVSRWSSYADDARLSSELMAQIAAAHRLSMLSGR
jgi:serine/threonine-protein kinase HipA